VSKPIRESLKGNGLIVLTFKLHRAVSRYGLKLIRLNTSPLLIGDEVIDRAIRPQNAQYYTGQDHVVNKWKFFIQALESVKVLWIICLLWSSADR